MTQLPYPLDDDDREELERQIRDAMAGGEPQELADERRDAIRGRCSTFVAKRAKGYDLLRKAVEQFSRSRWRTLLKEMGL